MLKKKKDERKAAAKERKKAKQAAAAATAIQSVYRGNRDRQKVSELRPQHIPQPTKTAAALGLLIVQILNASDLSDPKYPELRPYIKICFDGEVECTEAGEGECPEWNVEALFEVSSKIRLSDHVVELQLLHRVDHGEDVVMGVCIVPLKEIEQKAYNDSAKLLTLDGCQSGGLVATIRYEEGQEYKEYDTESESSSSDEELEESKFQEPQDQDEPIVWPPVFSTEPQTGWPPINENISSLDSIRVFVTTWNLQAQKPPDNLAEMLKPGKFHLYAIGTEECVNTIAKSVIFRSKKLWENRLRKVLGESYRLLCSHGLQAIHNVVFVHKSILPLVSRMKSSAVATGLGNQMGNKGGIGIRLIINDTSFLFVSCHFEAHQNRVLKRNANFHKIDRELKLSDKDGPCSNVFDRVFWAGDFNYRINGNRKMIDSLLHRDMHKVLLANDQLYLQKETGAVFDKFKEGPLNFRPSYKFDRGTDRYDTSAKQRIPSWTDRILYRSNGSSDSDIELLQYDSFDGIKTSDHRPVFAVFRVKIDQQPEQFESKDTHKIGNQTRSEVCIIQ